MDPSGRVTQLLSDYRQGQHKALDELLPLIYNELRSLAHRQRHRQRPSETLNTTALVHEAYFKLINQEGASWESRVHFFRVAAQAMRQILVDYARNRRAAKRGGEQPKLSLDAMGWDGPHLLTEERAEEVLALDEALQRLAALDERQSQIVELRYFIGLSIPETADVMGLSPATVKRDWTATRAWLYREMRKKG